MSVRACSSLGDVMNKMMKLKVCVLIRRKVTRQRAEAVQSLKVKEKVEAEVLGMKDHGAEILSELLLSTET